jgi:glycogen synthase
VKLRVLHCIYDDPSNPWVAGGGSVRVLELYKRLREAVDVTVATGNYPGARSGTREGIRYLRLGRPSPYAWSRLTYAASATRLLGRGSYDVAVFDFSVYTPLRVPLGAPVGITVHHVTGPSATQRWGRVRGALVEVAERRMLGRGRWFTATSRATYQLLAPLVRPDAKLFLVEAGVPDDLFALERKEEGYLLYFGRLDWFQKGLDTLLEAVAMLARSRRDVRIRIAGRGKDAERVVAVAAEMGISEHVVVLGSTSEKEKRALFAGASVLLMPSRFEGFGMVAAEAMAAGVPVVASAAGSLPEVVGPSGGRLVPAGDAAALAGVVEELLSDPAARAHLSQNARQSASRFRWEIIAAEHLAFLRQIHQDHGAKPAA